MKNFPWGRIIKDHEIGPFMVREYAEKNTGQTLYHGYINGNDVHEAWPHLDDVHEAWPHLDDALVGLITRFHVGPNSREVATHFMAGLRAMSAN